MNIGIGTLNPVKVSAAGRALLDYPSLAPFRLVPMDSPSGINEQPIGMPEIIKGALNRAQHAFATVENCSLAIGLESGIVPIGDLAFDLGVCAIYDGKRTNYGTTPGFIVPAQVAALVHQGRDLSQACKLAGLTSHSKIGTDIGIIGILTNGRMPREDYTKHSITMAMTAFENATLYT